jgi:hypothetical protein
VNSQSKKPKSKQVSKMTPDVAKGSREARRTAAVILEVLAGGRTPTSAAEAMKVSLPRYYALEARAIEGLMGACEPRRQGPRVSPEKKIAELERETRQLRSDVQRSQALLRLSQRMVGIPKAPEVPRKKTKGKRRKKPMKRALKAVERMKRVLDEPSAAAPPAAPVTPPVKEVPVIS